jgi:hypothetical protein
MKGEVMSLHNTLQTALDALRALSAKFDQIDATITNQGEVEASLVNVKAAHDKALAELGEEQRLLAEARTKHRSEMSAMADAARDAGAQLSALTEGMRVLHEASVQNLRKLVEARQ